MFFKLVYDAKHLPNSFRSIKDLFLSNISTCKYKCLIVLKRVKCIKYKNLRRRRVYTRITEAEKIQKYRDLTQEKINELYLTKGICFNEKACEKILEEEKKKDEENIKIQSKAAKQSRLGTDKSIEDTIRLFYDPCRECEF